MLMYTKICYNKKVGFGLQAVTKLPKGTKIAYYMGTIWSTKTAKEKGKAKYSHFLTVPGTGCSIDGSHVHLFDEAVPPLDKTFLVPCPLMSLTNSSVNYKQANCKMVINQEARIYTDGNWLDKTVYLVAVKDIDPYEELIWDYTYM